jgi:flagella basal body P-ring formation protein FlgA
MRPGTWTAVLAGGLALTLAAGSRAEYKAETIPVPRVAIYPGDVIQEEMLVEQPAAKADEGTRLFLTREGLVGKVARQTLLPGQPVPATSVR